MKTTGVIRRIDELGRIVIPKEIRKSLRIKDGENIEILIDNDNVILKRFSEMNRLTEMAENLVESIHNLLKRKKISLPIINLINDIIYENKDPEELVKFLLTKK